MTLEDILTRIDEMLENSRNDVDNDFIQKLLQQVELNSIFKEAAESFDTSDIFKNSKI